MQREVRLFMENERSLFIWKKRTRERERECGPSEGSDLGAGCGGGREDASQNDLWDSLACVCVQESIVYV